MLLHTKVYGGVVALPSMFLLPFQYSTRATLPSGSEAFAVNVIEAGVMYCAPLAGDVIETIGAWVAAANACGVATPAKRMAARKVVSFMVASRSGNGDGNQQQRRSRCSQRGGESPHAGGERSVETRHAFHQARRTERRRVVPERDGARRTRAVGNRDER